MQQVNAHNNIWQNNSVISNTTNKILLYFFMITIFQLKGEVWIASMFYMCRKDSSTSVLWSLEASFYFKGSIKTHRPSRVGGDARTLEAVLSASFPSLSLFLHQVKDCHMRGLQSTVHGHDESRGESTKRGGLLLQSVCRAEASFDLGESALSCVKHGGSLSSFLN